MTGKPEQRITLIATDSALTDKETFTKYWIEVQRRMR
jgi:hypothetical protein